MKSNLQVPIDERSVGGIRLEGWAVVWEAHQTKEEPCIKLRFWIIPCKMLSRGLVWLRVHFRQISLWYEGWRGVQERHYRSLIGRRSALETWGCVWETFKLWPPQGLRANAEEAVALCPLKSLVQSTSASRAPVIPLLLLFTLQVKAVHIRNINLLLGGPESGCGDSGPPSHLSPTPSQ